MVELVPDPHLIDSYINADQDWADACLEFVDNAFARDAGNADTISFRFERDAVAIWDDGQGVDNIDALFRLGQSFSQHHRDDLGFYGVGAKAAALWMGKRVEVRTIHDGRYHVHAVNWAAAKRRKRWPQGYVGKGRALAAAELPPELVDGRGTLIRIEGRWPGRKRLLLEPLCEALQQRCAPGLRAGKRIEVHREPVTKGQAPTHRSLRPFQPTQLTDVREFHGSIEGMGYRCKVGCMHDYNAKWTGLWIGWGHRVITVERRPFERSIPPRFYGEVDLAPEWKPCLTTFKNDIARHKEELFADIQKRCADFIELVAEYQEDLRLEVIAKDLSSHLTKLLTATSAPGGDRGGSTTDQPAARGPARGRTDTSVPEARASAAGSKTAEERTRRTGGLAVRWRDDLGPHAYRVDEGGGQIAIELNGRLPYVTHARERPINISATWGLIASAVAQHIGEQGPGPSRRLLPKLADAFPDEWSDGHVDRGLLFRQVYSYLIANVPDYREPALSALDRGG